MNIQTNKSYILSKDKFGYTITNEETRESFSERNNSERPTFNRLIAQLFPNFSL